MSEYRDENIFQTKRRLELLIEEWDNIIDAKHILQDILKCWPNPYEDAKERSTLMWKNKLALLHALQCKPVELMTDDEIEIGSILMKDREIQALFERARQRDKMKQVVDDLIGKGED